METTDPQRTKHLQSIQTILKSPLYKTWHHRTPTPALEQAIYAALPHIDKQTYHYALVQHKLIISTASQSVASQLFYRQNDILRCCQEHSIDAQDIHIKVCQQKN